MLHNDISNQRSYTIGFRCENTLLLPKESRILDKIRNVFSNKYLHAEVNQKVLSLMNYLYYDTEMSCVLVIDKDNYTPDIEKYLLDFPISQIKVIISNISEVTMMLNTGELTYFVTDDTIEKSLVNSRYATTFEDFNILIKRRVKRF